MRDQATCENLYHHFQCQAQNTPTAIAVVTDKQQYTFAELSEKVSKVACYLIDKGVTHGDYIGIYLPRSIDAIVSMLAVLATGAAYVPLDMAHPIKRSQAIIIDANCKFVITYKDCNSIETVTDHVFIEDCKQNKINKDLLASVSIHGSAPAYLIYTSGSTGVPKGVVIQHKNVLSLLSWAASVYSLEERSGVLAATSFCFDLSIFELFLPLTFGGTAILVENVLALAKDSNIKAKVKLINTVPSAIRELLQLNKIPESVTTINLAGEPLRQTLVNNLYQLPHIQKVYNLYAPSETTTYSTIYLANTNDMATNVAIGKAITGTRVFVLDKFMNPLPYQTKGEIYIAGEGVAQGYLNRPDLTAEKFIEHSFDGKNTLRLYRTGDIGRMRADKNIEFSGRVDHQIKLRGFRIELGEIEAGLMTHPLIHEAVVQLENAESNNPELVAYFLASSKLKTKELKQLLMGSLPSHFIPTEFNQLQQFPKTPNGKLDRLALHHYRQAQPKLDVGQHLPDEQGLQLLTSIWRELFPGKAIGLNDSFFQLGGHSLLATQLVTRIQQAFGVEFPLSEVFLNTTLLQQLNYLKQQQQIIPLPKVANYQQMKKVPLSYQQQRMWFLEQMHPDKAISNIPCVIKITGKVNLNAMTEALKEIIKRHKTLRTHYFNNNGRPVQSICETFDFSVKQIDMRDQDNKSVYNYIYEEAHRRFDFNIDLLLRATLLRTENTVYFLLLTLHHLSADAWSLNILTKEFNLLYQGYCSNDDVNLPIVIDYVDYALWQQENFSTDHLGQQKEYWQRQLTGARSNNPLPLDMSRPAKQSYQGAFYPLSISDKLSQQVRQICQKEKLTPFMFMLTGFYLLLYRYSNQKDISIGTPIANRTRNEIENTIGFFVNSLTLRIIIDENFSIKELLHQVRGVTLDAYNHQDVPFEQLVDLMGIKGENKQHPFFQLFFAWQSALPTSFDLPEACAEIIDFDRNISKFDLTFSLQEKQGAFNGLIEYSTDLFKPDTIERLAMQYENIIKQMVANVDNNVTSVSIVQEAEFNKIVYEWNQTQVDYPRKESVVALFNDITKLYPKNVALVADDFELTYCQLNSMANQYARMLQTYGIQPKTPVAIYLKRSPEMIIAILAILKLGAYYVPLATDLPEARLAHFINDTQTRHVITDSSHIDDLPVGEVSAICLDEVADDAAAQDDSNLPVITTGDDPIYIVYTSGTTGVPKGIMTLHHNVNRLVRNTNYVSLTSETTLLQISPISFDGATFEIWGSLLNGGKLVLMPHGVPELSKIIDLIYRWQINTLFITTQLFNALVEYYVDTITRLDVLLFGGEAASVQHVEKFMKANKKCKLCNIYGPTEATTYSCYYPITEIEAGQQSIAIGKPISNTTMYVLDENQRPVAVNTIGEIYIGGEGLAQGYINQPELTNEKFVTVAFKDDIKQRLYRTGDLGRFDNDGNIHFVGRVDDQIKRSGYRIELAEIEANIRSFATVKETVVLYDKPADQLIAYVMLNDSDNKDTSLMQKQLAKRLPKYMLPNRFIVVDSFELNSNGKIDKQRLLQTTATTDNADNSVVQCSNKLEKLIFDIWSEVLEFNDFTMEENFFDLGGSSLKMVHVLDMLQRSLKEQGHAKIPDMVELFTYPTITSLAQYITEHNGNTVTEKSNMYAEKRKRRMAQQKMKVIS